MTYTDTQLRKALAQMVPERIAYEVSEEEFVDGLYWNKGEDDGPKVLDTELQHLCWLVEETLDGVQQFSYVCELAHSTTYLPWNEIHATWQQRAIALAKVKGVEIV